MRLSLRHSFAAFHGLPPRLWLLCAVGLVNRAGTMVVPFLTLYLVSERGYSTSDVGLIGACFGGGAIAGSLLGGFASHRFGVIAVTLSSLVLGAAAFAVLPWLDSPLSMAVGVLVASTVNDAFRPALMTAVASTVDPASRVRALSAMRLALNLGMALGPAIGGMVAAIDYTWLFLGDAASCLLAAAALVWGIRRWGAASLGGERGQGPSPARDAPPPRRRHPQRTMAALLIVCAIYAIVIFQFFTTVPVFLHAEFAWSEAHVGQLLGLQALLIVGLQMPLVHRLEGRAPLRVAAVGAVLSCVALGVLTLGHGVSVAIPCTVLWAIGEMLSLPFLTTAVVNLAGDRPARAMGLFTAALSSGWIIAPGLGLWMSETWGWAALWIGCATVGVAIAGAMLLLASKAAEPHDDRKSTDASSRSTS
ncbi:MAG: MFS transporter [Deltaproteobacteria bacterium]|nr:MFS transporter [Deltaproteobacteria bacterium]